MFGVAVSKPAKDKGWSEILKLVSVYLQEHLLSELWMNINVKLFSSKKQGAGTDLVTTFVVVTVVAVEH